MYINKNMLAGAISMCKADKEFPIYNYVLIEKDGTIVSINQMVLFIGQSVIQEIPFGDKNNLKENIVISCESAEKIVKAIPADRLFKGILEHASLTLDNDNIKVEIKSGKSSHFLTIKNIKKEFIDWRKFIKQVYAEKRSAQSFVYNRLRLLSAITTLENACKYEGKFSPVFCEVSGENKMLWRAQNELTGQRIWIVFDFSVIKEKWPELNDWEKSFVSAVSSNLKVKGDQALARWLNRNCPLCDCRLRSDTKINWCSNEKCNYTSKCLKIAKRT